MILSIAHASLDDPAGTDMFGAWSDIVVGARPAGLIDCYLLEGDGTVQVAALWESVEDHDRAVELQRDHPAFGFFAACGVDPTHTVFKVIGRIG